MTKTAKINSARVYGSIAFANGANCVPANDADCMTLLSDEAVGGNGVAIMKAWIVGWTQACLAA